LVAVAALALVSCAEQINMLKARKAFQDANGAYAAKNYAKAIEEYSRVVEMDPQDRSQVLTHSLFYLGSSHHMLFRPARDDAENRAHLDKAIEFYEKTLQRDPQYRYAIEQLAGIYRDNLDDFENAEKYFKMILDLEPNKPENWYSLGALYERFHDPDTMPLFDKAIEAYKKPIEFSPNDPAVYRQVAGLLNKYGRFEETMEWLAKARDVQPDNPEGYYTMATYYWDKVYRDPELKIPQRREYIDLGMTQLDKALELKPEYVEALIYKGLMLREQSKIEPNARRQQALLDEAKQYQEKAIELKKQQDAAAAAAAAQTSGAPTHN
jgi:tetratricopeptide (TPR) repeat protein